LNPPYAIAARFDYNPELVQCLQGTRIEILDEIALWIIAGVKSPLSEFTPACSSSTATAGSEKRSCIFWINGLAGSGKTTIAFTIAQRCQNQGILGASFFCSRENADCSNLKLVFTTVAYQLGQFCPEFKDELSRVLKSDPDIVYSSVSYQLEKLLVEPLLAVGDKFPPAVVVIDALDECKDDNATSTILSSLSFHIAKLSPLQFFITSRPNLNITGAFEMQELSSRTQPLALYEVRLDIITRDIQHYLTQQLGAIRQLYHLQSSWPSSTDIEALTNMSSGLFIFAATAIKFIKVADPIGQLESLLEANIVTGSSPLQRLDCLYLQVLNIAFPDVSPRMSGRLKMILGSIALLQDVLPLGELEQLLSCTTQGYLQRLLSVVVVPKENDGLICFIHPSFFDFIIDPMRCSQIQFRVNAQIQHTFLAHRCLTAMKKLQRDICGLRDPTKLNQEFLDLPERVALNILPCLQYACRHWSMHLSNSMLSSDLLELLHHFCTKHLMHWIEVCSLLGNLHSALVMLNSVQTFLAVSPYK
jgi:hypothetical protein